MVSGMTEYQIQANTRRCTVTGRELQPGERFYSVLFDQSGQFVRQDYSREGWPGTPEGAFSFWTGTVPPLDEPRRPRIFAAGFGRAKTLGRQTLQSALRGRVGVLTSRDRKEAVELDRSLAVAAR